ncbi:carbohydrate ABC transporter permease [Herpetosiphon llansteffanensis]|uniref:carbohydrate ABC transporter permease n=1 Tax=Herpetosiphon llansteffanensis TaxID=2094568 RepID=UPI000D7B98B6|nr:sugar ABC transporter permease [Herpetosiphon llansteffanensis]
MSSQPQTSTGPRSRNTSEIVRLLLVPLALIISILVGRWSLGVMKDADAPRFLVVGVALLVGVFGIWIAYWLCNELLNLIPSETLRERIRPVIFVGPALALLIIYLVYPTVMTAYYSVLDKNSETFVGLENFKFAFTNRTIQIALRNNLYWIVGVTSFSVVGGLVMAVLFDKVRYEAVAKSMIFLPMIISFVGAGVIWRFMYASNPPGVGLLNAFIGNFDFKPVAWLINKSVNNIALIVIMIWLQTGFCLVILSAALKAIPADIIDAARVDGAGELDIFWRIIIPSLKTTILTVVTTVVIAVLKVFDIVFVMTNGNYETEVIANRMFTEFFRNQNYGLSSALTMILVIAVLPVMIINVRNARRQRG